MSDESENKKREGEQNHEALRDQLQDLDDQFAALSLKNDSKLSSVSTEYCKFADKPYKVKIVRFQRTETIEGLGSQDAIDEANKDIKVVHKSSNGNEINPRIEMINERDSLVNRITLGSIFDKWTNIANSDAFSTTLCTGDSSRIRQNKSTRKAKRKSTPSGDKISAKIKKNRTKMKSFKKCVVEQHQIRINPSYKDTVASRLRYDFRRNKKVCPYYIVQHVMKYQRPPFWNYTKMGKGFNGLLSREQLQQIYDI